MEEFFTITVLHQGEEKELSGRLRVSAYTHQFIFLLDGSEIIIERDDNGNFRALTSPMADRTADPALVQALLKEMEKQLND